MAKEPKTGELVEVQVTTALDLDKDDILAIGITEAEEYMQNELLRCKDEAQRAGEEANEHAKNRNKILAEAGKEFAAGIEEQLTEGLACLNIRKLNFNHSTTDLRAPAKKGGKYHYDINVQCQEVDNRRGCHGNLSLSRTFTETAPKEAVAEKKAEDTAHKRQHEANEEALEWKRRLSRIPQYERKLRAELAKQRLEKSTVGRQVLSTMLGDVKGKVLALPGK